MKIPGIVPISILYGVPCIQMNDKSILQLKYSWKEIGRMFTPSPHRHTRMVFRNWVYFDRFFFICMQLYLYSLNICEKPFDTKYT